MEKFQPNSKNLQSQPHVQLLQEDEKERAFLHSFYETGIIVMLFLVGNVPYLFLVV